MTGHHAILFVGTFSDVLRTLPKEEQVPSTDVEHVVTDRFGIGDARALAHESTRTPLERSHRTFIVSFNEATHEAQNALLKTLEEPAATSRFYIIVPRSDVLIATVRSRLFVSDQKIAPKTEYEEVHSFIKASYAERLQEIAERTKEKNTTWVNILLDGLEVYASETKNTDLMRELLFVRSYIHTTGASKKMLLEHLALTF